MTGDQQNIEAVRSTELNNVPAQGTLHTPGPWRVDSLCVDSVTHGNICVVNLARRSQADLNLIAAAPDLLAALKTCRDELVALNKGIGWRDGEWSQVTIANAAIAKAEGK